MPPRVLMPNLRDATPPAGAVSRRTGLPVKRDVPRDRMQEIAGAAAISGCEMLTARHRVRVSSHLRLPAVLAAPRTVVRARAHAAFLETASRCRRGTGHCVRASLGSNSLSPCTTRSPRLTWVRPVPDRRRGEQRHRHAGRAVSAARREPHREARKCACTACNPRLSCVRTVSCGTRRRAAISVGARSS